MLTITGYHRLWAHRAYRATTLLKLFFAVAGSAAGAGTIRRFARDHRAHHRYTDTDRDPHSVHKGFFHTHLGWVIFKQDPKRIGRVNIDDIDADPIVVWQHCNYIKLFVLIGIIVPTVFCGWLWADWVGGLVFGGILRTCFTQQCILCINSVAHSIGERPFDSSSSARNNALMALITNGEGYHNFHHQFPSDYRNGIEWYDWDPSKWTIYVCERLGLAHDIKRFRYNEISKRRLQEQQKSLKEKCSRLEWGIPLAELPIVTWKDFSYRSTHGEALIAIAGIVYDASSFLQSHPGGTTLISSVIGQDATASFNGGAHNHSENAHNILSLMRIGVLLGGGEVENWKNRESIEDMG